MKNSKVEEYRKKYPFGTKIRLTADLDDPYVPKKTGDIFVVHYVDDAGQLHGYWESGSSIAVIPEKDKFEIVKD